MRPRLGLKPIAALQEESVHEVVAAFEGAIQPFGHDRIAQNEYFCIS